jgi:hypothetical protein
MEQPMNDYIKELAPRLPYGVKMHHEEYGEPSIMDLIGVEIGAIIMHDRNVLQSMSDTSTWAKPIYRPLPDLTKEITHKGETFVPMDRLKEIADCASDEEAYEHIDDFTGKFHEVNWGAMPYRFIQWLLEHHFDINGWIEQGKAIDVNTLKENCYENDTQ